MTKFKQPKLPSLDDRTGAPFNMAIATLMAIRDILDQIKQVTITNELSSGEAQQIKHKLVSQLFVQSIPLLKDEQKEPIKRMIKKVKLTSIPKLNEYRKVIGYVVVYNPEIEEELDNITIKIQEDLQSQGYFMPPKNDPKYSWRYG